MSSIGYWFFLVEGAQVLDRLVVGPVGDHLLGARPVGTVHEGAGDGAFGDAVGLVVGVPADVTAVARGHIAVSVVEVTHPIGFGKGMGASVILAIDVTAYIGFVGDVADGVVVVTLGHLYARTVAQSGAGQSVDVVVEEFLSEVLVKIVALFLVAGQVEVIGEALDGIGPVAPGGRCSDHSPG